MPNKRFVSLVVGIWLFVAATNRFTNPDRDQAIVATAAGDSFSYFAIAESAPRLPVDRHLPFHHAQRLAIPFLLGLANRVVPISSSNLFLVCVAVLQLMTLLVVATIAFELQLSAAQAELVVAIMAFNPWASRYYLAFPGMVADVAFVFGLSVVLLGLFRQRLSLVFAGLLFAAVARQTTLVLIPGTLLWIWLDWERVAPHGLRWRTLVAASVIGLPFVVYLMTARIATQFAAPSENLDHLTGLFTWARSSFNVRTLAAFVLRAITPLAMAVSIWLGCRRWDGGAPSWSRQESVRSWLLAGLALSVCAQPLLGGPAKSSDAVIRLTSLALVPVALAVALQVRRARLFDHVAGATPVLVLGAIIAVASMHHETTYLGWSPEQLPRFAVILASASLGAFLVTRSDCMVGRGSGERS
jgi:hypothetical protein